jgi:hypothetical protein
MDVVIIRTVGQECGLPVQSANAEQAREMLAEGLNELIEKDFQRLVYILYRADVSEEKLRRLLNENKQAAAGYVIADLLIERQEQKLKSRQQYKDSRRDNEIDENEKW